MSDSFGFGGPRNDCRRTELPFIRRYEPDSPLTIVCDGTLSHAFAGQNWIPRPGHQWLLFHGHGQDSAVKLGGVSGQCAAERVQASA